MRVVAYVMTQSVSSLLESKASMVMRVSEDRFGLGFGCSGGTHSASMSNPSRSQSTNAFTTGNIQKGSAFVHLWRCVMRDVTEILTLV